MPGRPPATTPLARLVAAADFERVLGARSRATTAHFSVHHLAAQPTARAGARKKPAKSELSTIGEPAIAQPVEDSPRAVPPRARSWVGAVVPKRHARRAVTRSLIKRQIYAATLRHRESLAPGLWIVRLRAPFDPLRFTSAASPALRQAVRGELDAALAAASARALP